MNKKIFLLIIFISLQITAALFGQSDAVLWYHHPATYFEETLVLGNGKMGASVSGGVSSDKIYLYDITLWSGEPINPNNNPGAFDILHHINEMDSISLFKAKGSTSSRFPPGLLTRTLKGFCCRLPMQFAFTQANPACPAVCMSHWFSRLLLVLNVKYLKISLFIYKIFLPFHPVPEVNGFYGQNDNRHTHYPALDQGSITRNYTR
jgi:hypothetical protein